MAPPFVGLDFQTLGYELPQELPKPSRAPEHITQISSLPPPPEAAVQRPRAAPVQALARALPLGRTGRDLEPGATGSNSTAGAAVVAESTTGAAPTGLSASELLSSSTTGRVSRAMGLATQTSNDALGTDNRRSLSASGNDPANLLPGGATGSSPGGVGDGTATGTRLSPEEQARRVAGNAIGGALAEGSNIEPSHVTGYYQALRRRMRETWRPGFYRTPNMVDALIAVPRAMARYANRYRQRANRYSLTGAPDEPGTQPPVEDELENRASFSVATTSTIVEVEQDDSGQVIAVRIVRSARLRDFDNAAVEAVRTAVSEQALVPMPGGRRSRWAFDVAASRDPIVPMAGFRFDESTGYFEMHYPGALHVKTRIRKLGSRPLGAPWDRPIHHDD